MSNPHNYYQMKLRELREENHALKAQIAELVERLKSSARETHQ